MNQPSPNADQFKTLPGGVRISIARIDGDDVVHGTVMGDVLYKVIEDEARAHGAAFNGPGFNKVINAISANKLQGYVAIMAEPNARPQFVGGAIEFPTVITEWDGRDFRFYPAVYGEDTCVSPHHSKIFRELTRIGLGSYFMHERIRASVTNEFGSAPYGMIGRGRVAEMGAENSSAIRWMNKFGATIEAGGSPVLIFDGDNQSFRDRQKVSVQTWTLANDTQEILSNVFVTGWTNHNAKQKIVATFTEAISSFTGEPVVRIQFTSNGNPPREEILKDVLVGLLQEGVSIVTDRKWLSADDANVNPITAMRIHTLGEPEISLALRGMGATPRLLGAHTMQPLITNLKNMPEGAVNFSIPEAKELTLIVPDSNAAPRPSNRRFIQQTSRATGKVAATMKL